MTVNPQKMFNDKFGSPEQQNEQSFKQVFPSSPTPTVIEDLCKNTDLSNLVCAVIKDDNTPFNIKYRIGVPVAQKVQTWEYDSGVPADISYENLEKHCKEVFYELSKWGYALAVYSQIIQLKETELELWFKLQTSTTRTNFLATSTKAPTEKFIEEMTIAQNYQEYSTRATQLATLKNTKEVIRQGIVEPLKEKSRQITNLVEVLKITRQEK